jgi:hypothetical protein
VLAVGRRPETVADKAGLAKWNLGFRLHLPGAKGSVFNRVPACAKEPIFQLSQFEKCSYIEKAQRFLTTTDLN